MNLRKRWLIIVLLCASVLLVSSVSAQSSATVTLSGEIREHHHHVKVPVALFNTKPKVGKVPLTVTFTDKSTHNPTSWKWDFDDGTTSNVQNPPPHTYTRAGTYHVKLTACNRAGCDSGMRSVFALPKFHWSGHGGDNGNDDDHKSNGHKNK